MTGRGTAGEGAHGDSGAIDGAELAATRRTLHAVAELVLAGPQYRATGRLRLAVVPGGFATTSLTPPLRAGRAAVTSGDGPPAAIAGTTARALAAALGVTPGRPEGAYGDGSGADLDEPLALDPAAAGVITGALAAGQEALTAFAPGETPVLWPEHFDVAIRVGGVNYGVSPGDGFLGEPYAYVGIAAPPDGDPFWNAPFGAARPLRELGGAAALARFLAGGRDRAR